jgi:hypothetical protein
MSRQRMSKQIKQECKKKERKDFELSEDVSRQFYRYTQTAVILI